MGLVGYTFPILICALWVHLEATPCQEQLDRRVLMFYQLFELPREELSPVLPLSLYYLFVTSRSTNFYTRLVASFAARIQEG
ncbi:uncharacterized protein B0H64DRAFT_403777 [Chaetomium fimeti]|uniref:Secreted protein n=1 Tax=Chaetomium fimeti TaxID=1854472 RepID=A0AAE0HBE3_9PEZI|nr:hypothetical protein B0H64DRAFT_403777 [Chaetomium fimeti]